MCEHFFRIKLDVEEINEGQSKQSPTSHETLTCNCVTDKYSDMINYPISVDEVEKAVKRYPK